MTGTYTEITDIVAYSTAAAGSTVNVEVRLKNLHSLPVNIWPGITEYNGNAFFVYDADGLMHAWVNPGETHSWFGSFIMPNEDALIHVESWYEGQTQWYADDSKDVVISLSGAAVELAGEIEYVKILKGSLEQSIPATGIEVSDKILLRVKVKNTGTASFRPYLYYRYTKPDGSVLGSTEARLFEFDSGNSHTFSEPAFGIPVDQPGNWYVYCELRDDYNGNILATFSKALLFNAGGIAEELEILGVNITPVGKGHILTNPASEEGKTEWHDGDTGGFPSGTDVEVTAVPVSGYVFEKWSDEIVGGVSYSNPAYVKPMIQHRGVKAHFVPEEEDGEVPLILSGLNVVDYYKKV